MTARRPSSAEGRTRSLPPLGALGRFVDARVSGLQRQYLGRSSTTAAILAQLRRAVSKDPGSVPEVWSITLDGVPLPAGYRSDEPSWNERATHSALTLYAIHQQSKSEPMHQRSVGLGAAARRLARATGAEEAVTRRFHAIGTATDFTETTHHARGLVTQLRGAGIPLDYAQLADQLVWLQHPASANRVRLAWGRDFYRTESTDTPAASAAPANGD